MPKRKYRQSLSREVDGKFYTFEVYEEAGMITVQGNGDKRSTGKPRAGDPSTVIINSLIRDLVNRGKIRPVGR